MPGKTLDDVVIDISHLNPTPPSNLTQDHSRRQQLQRLRYTASRAERQYQQVDPENRLIAAELERRWEAALRELRPAPLLRR